MLKKPVNPLLGIFKKYQSSNLVVKIKIGVLTRKISFY